jgi:tetraacyldisaccharide 4'-kinase
MAPAAHRAALQHGLTRAWRHRGWVAWLLWPLSLAYSALLALRQALYHRGWLAVARCPVPVLVVGNVVAGGAGKTPVLMALVRHLQARGLQVGVISRGYGRRSTGCLEAQPDSPAREVGDEPALIRRSTGAPVVVAERRAEAAASLLASHPATQLILCDDGLQHTALHRDFEVCVFDDRGLGNGFLLPAGPLREPWPRPVDLVLHTGTQPAFAGHHARRQLAPYAVRQDGARVALATLADAAQPLLALAAIAQPDQFFAMLSACGLPLARTLALPDHYDFDSFNPNEYKGYSLICTEKDAVKLWPLAPAALAVPLQLTLPPSALATLDAWLAQCMPAKLSSTHGHTTA